MYAIQFEKGIGTSLDISDIEKEATRLVKKRKTATIFKDGIKIGWVGEDLSKRIGWGYFINTDLL